MPRKTYTPNARKRILDAAKQIFAAKGFDGSRVDEIAKTAKVPKSLIYYHFKSKDEILAQLLDECLGEYKAALKTAHTDPRTSDPKALAERIRAVYQRFLEENDDLLRIISMESLKKHSSKARLAFRVVEILMEFEVEHLKSRQRLTEEEKSQRMIAEFFTGQVPLILFFCLREAWADYFKTDRDTVTQQFITAFEATYGTYKMPKVNEGI